jgi:hypothetical protein
LLVSAGVGELSKPLGPITEKSFDDTLTSTFADMAIFNMLLKK